MGYIMTSNDFIARAKDIAKNHKTVYVNGTFGRKLTRAIIDDNARRLKWSNVKRDSYYKYVGTHYGFDCIGLIKGILWGWTPDKCPYTTNGVPDVSETAFFNSFCSGISSDFNNITAGELVWTTGHIGIYVGNGEVVEASPAFNGDVQVTWLANLGTNGKYNNRKWLKHGKCIWIEYKRGISYRSHVQGDGWLNWVGNGLLSGTTGQSKRMEAIQINCPGINLSYKVHVQGIGWMDSVGSGVIAGTTGKSKRLEAIVINADVPISYRVHVQGVGWMSWKMNGQVAGTTGEARRMEAIEIKLGGV